MKLSEASFDVSFNLFKGEPGTRKSTCALSYPTPQYWVSTDQKMEAMVLPAKRWGVDMDKDVHFDDYTDWNKPKAYLEKLKLNCPYKTIIIDSITSMGDAMTSQVKRFKGQGGGKTIGGIAVSGFEEFNAEAAGFQEMIEILKDIHKFHKVNIIMIAHVLGVRKDDPNNKHTHHSRIIVTGAERISAKLSFGVTEAYHFNIKADFDADKGGHYALRTVHTGNDYARTSLPLKEEIVFDNDPLYEKWIAPAIKALKDEKPIYRVTPQTPTTNQPTTNKFVQ
jgi:hypothetical protein